MQALEMRPPSVSETTLSTAVMLMKGKSLNQRCPDAALQDRRLKLWIVGARAPTETNEGNSKVAFYDLLNALMPKMPNQEVVIVGIDANAKIGLEQQSDVLGEWYNPAKCTSDNVTVRSAFENR
ncbi:hypothetical protein RB195_022340 [Necator americanus]|uniref:SLC12A transporter C-terminal domain-containing protein n=1 Tax=Necator americanus TaxID=51031 RepID=A0ABR1EEX7_NECAM